jgi:peptide/nickel transport system ATP-binding protein
VADVSTSSGRSSVDAGRPLVDVAGLSIKFPVGRSGFWGGSMRYVHAVDDVSFSIARGETLGLVGESGSGKTTIGRAVLRRIPPSAGSIRFRGDDITQTKGAELRQLRRHMQLVFQDPYASLNPRMTVLELVAEPLVVHGLAKDAAAARPQVVDLLDRCGLPVDTVDRYPHAFSGGQRQRIGIARALALRPEFIVADEPVSALDVSVRAQVVNLLQDLQHELGLTYLFIAHDLSVVHHISSRIAVMYLGNMMEIATNDQLYFAPKHPYSRALLSAVPEPNPEKKGRKRIVLQGDIPTPLNKPSGCSFRTRCPVAQASCAEGMPALQKQDDGRMVACPYVEKAAVAMPL